jgi:formylglycine-generating enzyme required for sulfatase activity
MGKYEVTQAQYQAVMGLNPSYFSGSSRQPASGEVQERRPVEQVSWYDAIVFCNKLSIREGLPPVYSINGITDPAILETANSEAWDTVEADWNAVGYRLPTEAEWEYACRAGTETVYNTGDAISANTGWYTSNSDSKTHEVGKKPPNAWGLYDMHGNVYEWCWDRYGENYYTATGAGTDPRGPSTGSYRVKRGGSWNTGTNIYLRSAYRGIILSYSTPNGSNSSNNDGSYFYPSYRRNGVGLRVARSLSGTVSGGSSSNGGNTGSSASGGNSSNGGTITSSASGSSSSAAAGPMDMVWIEPGSFVMGSPGGESRRRSDETMHLVTLTRGFYRGKYEVTQKLYKELMIMNPSYFYGTGRPPASGEVQEMRPVEQVSWYDAIVFCNKLSIREGLPPVYSINGITNPAVLGAANSEAWNTVEADWNANGYRLPTEAEWEYACRAGTDTVYNTGDAISASTGWYSVNSGSKTHEVGHRDILLPKPPNAWGLYDMHGNVYEWCWDRYGENYYTATGAGTDPRGPSTGSYRVNRGGSWFYGNNGNNAQYVRSASRGGYYNGNSSSYHYYSYFIDGSTYGSDYSYPTMRSASIGIRLARTQ